MTKPTARPWRDTADPRTGDITIIDGSGRTVAVLCVDDDQIAAHIVKCVNAHEELEAQIRDQARTIVLMRMNAKPDTRNAVIAELVAELEFYADEENWKRRHNPKWCGYGPMWRKGPADDRGEHARKVLKKAGVK